ncbi:MAG: hypothetical protein OXH59_02775 [Rhodospirillaceae bacterium]|nr:hypothetical protein [Rhodospirillaceae bacterium]
MSSKLRSGPLALTALAAAVAFAAPAGAQQNLTAETASPGGVPHATITTLAELASAAGIANFQVAEGQTLTNSLQNLAQGKTDVAAVPLILPFLLSRGAGPYGKLGKKKGAELVKNTAALYTYTYGGYGLYAFDSSSVKGWKDIKGKTIVNGPPRGAALNIARAIVRIATGYSDGKDYKGVQSNWGQMVKTITDGTGDAMVLPITFPDTRILRSLGSGSITLWSVPKKAWDSKPMQRYLKAPGTAPWVIDLKTVKPIKGLTIVSEDGIFRSPGTAGAEMVQTSMSFDLAKALTKTAISNVKKFTSKAPYMANIFIGEIDPAKTGMCGPVPVKYHPGAVAAWEEAGHKVPDCAKP